MWGIEPQTVQMQSGHFTTLTTFPVLVMETSFEEDHVDMNKQQTEHLPKRGLARPISFDVVFYLLMLYAHSMLKDGLISLEEA